MLSLFRQAAVFETQCCASGCTFNSYGHASYGSEICSGEMLSKLNEIQSSINNIWERKPTTIGWCMNIFIIFFISVVYIAFNISFILCKKYVTNLWLNAFVWIQIACKHGWKRYNDHCYHLFSVKNELVWSTGKHLA